MQTHIERSNDHILHLQPVTVQWWDPPDLGDDKISSTAPQNSFVLTLPASALFCHAT